MLELEALDVTVSPLCDGSDIGIDRSHISASFRKDGGLTSLMTETPEKTDVDYIRIRMVCMYGEKVFER